MSVFMMTRLLQERQLQDQDAGRLLERTRLDAAEPGTAAQGIEDSGPSRSAEAAKRTTLEKLASFVPTEVITAWAAAVGLLVPTAHWQRWLIFAAAVAVMIVLIVLNSALLRKQVQDHSRPVAAAAATSGMLRLIAISTIAFTIWAFAAPGSPAIMWGEDTTRLFAVVALFVTPVLYKAAQLWGLAPLEP
jgi:hypothetical protein